MSGERSLHVTRANREQATPERQPNTAHGAVRSAETGFAAVAAPADANVAAAASSRSQRGRRNFWQVFGAPTVLAVISTVGLIAALVGDGAYDAVSWITLTIPVIVIAKYMK